MGSTENIKIVSGRGASYDGALPEDAEPTGSITMPAGQNSNHTNTTVFDSGDDFYRNVSTSPGVMLSPLVTASSWLTVNPLAVALTPAVPLLTATASTLLKDSSAIELDSSQRMLTMLKHTKDPKLLSGYLDPRSPMYVFKLLQRVRSESHLPESLHWLNVHTLDGFIEDISFYRVFSLAAYVELKPADENLAGLCDFLMHVMAELIRMRLESAPHNKDEADLFLKFAQCLLLIEKKNDEFPFLRARAGLTSIIEARERNERAITHWYHQETPKISSALAAHHAHFGELEKRNSVLEQRLARVVDKMESTIKGRHHIQQSIPSFAITDWQNALTLMLQCRLERMQEIVREMEQAEKRLRLLSTEPFEQATRQALERKIFDAEKRLLWLAEQGDRSIRPMEIYFQQLLSITQGVFTSPYRELKAQYLSLCNQAHNIVLTHDYYKLISARDTQQAQDIRLRMQQSSALPVQFKKRRQEEYALAFGQPVLRRLLNGQDTLSSDVRIEDRVQAAQIVHALANAPYAAYYQRDAYLRRQQQVYQSLVTVDKQIAHLVLETRRDENYENDLRQLKRQRDNYVGMLADITKTISSMQEEHDAIMEAIHHDPVLSVLWRQFNEKETLDNKNNVMLFFNQVEKNIVINKFTCIDEKHKTSDQGLRYLLHSVYALHQIDNLKRAESLQTTEQSHESSAVLLTQLVKDVSMALSRLKDHASNKEAVQLTLSVAFNALQFLCAEGFMVEAEKLYQQYQCALSESQKEPSLQYMQKDYEKLNASLLMVLMNGLEESEALVFAPTHRARAQTQAWLRLRSLLDKRLAHDASPMAQSVETYVQYQTRKTEQWVRLIGDVNTQLEHLTALFQSQASEHNQLQRSALKALIPTSVDILSLLSVTPMSLIGHAQTPMRNLSDVLSAHAAQEVEQSSLKVRHVSEVVKFLGEAFVAAQAKGATEVARLVHCVRHARDEKTQQDALNIMYAYLEDKPHTRLPIDPNHPHGDQSVQAAYFFACLDEVPVLAYLRNSSSSLNVDDVENILGKKKNRHVVFERLLNEQQRLQDKTNNLTETSWSRGARFLSMNADWLIAGLLTPAMPSVLGAAETVSSPLLESVMTFMFESRLGATACMQGTLLASQVGARLPWLLGQAAMRAPLLTQFSLRALHLAPVVYVGHRLTEWAIQQYGEQSDEARYIGFVSNLLLLTKLPATLSVSRLSEVVQQVSMLGVLNTSMMLHHANAFIFKDHQTVLKTVDVLIEYGLFPAIGTVGYHRNLQGILHKNFYDIIHGQPDLTHGEDIVGIQHVLTKHLAGVQMNTQRDPHLAKLQYAEFLKALGDFKTRQPHEAEWYTDLENAFLLHLAHGLIDYNVIEKLHVSNADKNKLMHTYLELLTKHLLELGVSKESIERMLTAHMSNLINTEVSQLLKRSSKKNFKNNLIKLGRLLSSVFASGAREVDARMDAFLQSPYRQSTAQEENNFTQLKTQLQSATAHSDNASSAHAELNHYAERFFRAKAEFEKSLKRLMAGELSSTEGESLKTLIVLQHATHMLRIKAQSLGAITHDMGVFLEAYALHQQLRIELALQHYVTTEEFRADLKTRFFSLKQRLQNENDQESLRQVKEMETRYLAKSLGADTLALLVVLEQTHMLEVGIDGAVDERVRLKAKLDVIKRHNARVQGMFPAQLITSGLSHLWLLGLCGQKEIQVKKIAQILNHQGQQVTLPYAFQDAFVQLEHTYVGVDGVAYPVGGYKIDYVGKKTIELVGLASDTHRLVMSITEFLRNPPISTETVFFKELHKAYYHATLVDAAQRSDLPTQTTVALPLKNTSADVTSTSSVSSTNRLPPALLTYHGCMQETAHVLRHDPHTWLAMVTMLSEISRSLPLFSVPKNSIDPVIMTGLLHAYQSGLMTIHQVRHFMNQFAGQTLGEFVQKGLAALPPFEFVKYIQSKLFENALKKPVQPELPEYLLLSVNANARKQIMTWHYRIQSESDHEKSAFLAAQLFDFISSQAFYEAKNNDSRLEPLLNKLNNKLTFLERAYERFALLGKTTPRHAQDMTRSIHIGAGLMPDHHTSLLYLYQWSLEGGVMGDFAQQLVTGQSRYAGKSEYMIAFQILASVQHSRMPMIAPQLMHALKQPRAYEVLMGLNHLLRSVETVISAESHTWSKVHQARDDRELPAWLSLPMIEVAMTALQSRAVKPGFLSIPILKPAALGHAMEVYRLLADKNQVPLVLRLSQAVFNNTRLSVLRRALVLKELASRAFEIRHYLETGDTQALIHQIERIEQFALTVALPKTDEDALQRSQVFAVVQDGQQGVYKNGEKQAFNTSCAVWVSMALNAVNRPSLAFVYNDGAKQKGRSDYIATQFALMAKYGGGAFMPRKGVAPSVMVEKHAELRAQFFEVVFPVIKSLHDGQVISDNDMNIIKNAMGRGAPTRELRGIAPRVFAAFTRFLQKQPTVSLHLNQIWGFLSTQSHNSVPVNEPWQTLDGFLAMIGTAVVEGDEHGSQLDKYINEQNSAPASTVYESHVLPAGNAETVKRALLSVSMGMPMPLIDRFGQALMTQTALPISILYPPSRTGQKPRGHALLVLDAHLVRHESGPNIGEPVLDARGRFKWEFVVFEPDEGQTALIAGEQWFTSQPMKPLDEAPSKLHRIYLPDTSIVKQPVPPAQQQSIGLLPAHSDEPRKPPSLLFRK